MMDWRLHCYLKWKRLYKITVYRLSVFLFFSLWSKEIEKILLNTVAECYQCHTLDCLKEIQQKKDGSRFLQSMRDIKNSISLLMWLYIGKTTRNIIENSVSWYLCEDNE